MKMTLIYGILLCLPWLIVSQTPDIYTIPNDIFQKIDANGDGLLVKTEMEHFFQAYDDDGDGRVSRSEYISHVTWEYGHDDYMFQMLDTLYSGIDLNHDHHVDTADFDILFDLNDLNKDGQVSKQEFITVYVQSMSSAVVG